MFVRLFDLVRVAVPLSLCAMAFLTSPLLYQPAAEPAKIIRRAPPASESARKIAAHIGELAEAFIEVQATGNRIYAELMRAQAERDRLARDPKPVLVEMIRSYNPALSGSYALTLATAIERSGQAHSVDPFLIAALISKESRFRPQVVSPGGAVGLGQLLPGTARELGVNCYDPEQNIEGCARYLGRQLRTWKQTSDPVALGLASYNAGPGRVHQYGGVPPYSITRDYVRVIKSRYQKLQNRARARAQAIALRPLTPGS